MSATTDLCPSPDGCTAWVYDPALFAHRCADCGHVSRVMTDENAWRLGLSWERHP